MGFWDAVIILAMIGAFAFVRSARYRAGIPDERRPNRMLGDRVAGDSREHELEAEIIELRKRIAVLERIATEERKSRDIAAEIEALRD